MALWNQMDFQDSSSFVMKELILLHDHCMFILFLIMTVMMALFIMFMANKLPTKTQNSMNLIEVIWTVIPMLILILMAIPSLQILYMMEDTNLSFMTLKIIGHQWYWSYEYTDFYSLEFDSYMLPTENLMSGDYRLLSVDNKTPLPMNMNIRLLVSASDVIHSWAIPSLGMKIDAIPGRLNQTMMLINRPGVFYGQCSEICGTNHSFMPIVIESIMPKLFINWVKKM
uniref:Cytochrome c oxidase subunit 2 n=1 Tax=Endomyzostoma sp. MZ-2009 TaxID=644517 RepID=C7BG50_9ANNE|nr:cytochrome c oxidase subunit II [Endomyzostoma sp. MZ-2009]